MNQQSFFIVGCQRSGTTLMRLVLECHSKILCFDEFQGYQVLASGAYHPPPDKDRVGFKIPRWTEQLDQSRLCDFGLKVEADRFYTGQPILFMLRDVRDTVTSMITFKAGRRSWLEVWAMPTVDWMIKRSKSFRVRFSPEIEQLHRSKSPEMTYGALYWKYKTVAYFEYFAKAWPVLGVRYENLVGDPQAQLERIVKFLGLEWEPAVLEHPSYPHDQLRPSGIAIGGTDPSRAIDETSVGQWERFLLPKQIDCILTIAGDLNQQMLQLT